MIRSTRSTSGIKALTTTVNAVWWLSLAATVILTGLIVLVAAGTAGTGIVSVDFYYQLPASAYHVAAPHLASTPARIGLSSGRLSISHPRLPFVLAGSAVLAVAATGWLFILHQLRRLVQSIADGEPFAAHNAKRLRRIGLAVICFELARAIAVWAGALYFEHVLVARGLTVRSHFGVDVPIILLGLLLLALAAAFRRGSELAEEQALTV